MAFMALRDANAISWHFRYEFKKSLGEDRANIHGNQIKKRKKESDDGFLL
jgi:hypothetical protein